MTFENDSEDSEDLRACPVCQGPGMLLGILGSLTWLRCQNCGMDFCLTPAGLNYRDVKEL